MFRPISTRPAQPFAQRYVLHQLQASITFALHIPKALKTPTLNSTTHSGPEPDEFTGSIAHAVEQGLAYLQAHQFPYGEFCCYMAGDEPMKGWMVQVNMIFPTMLVCQSLQYLPQTPELKKMTMQAGWFLKAHMGRGAVWHHYTWMHSYYDVLPFDVDDTCCTAAALDFLGIDYPKNATRHIVLANRTSKGLFYTWFSFRWRWNPLRTYWRLALREFISPVKGFFFWRSVECSRRDVDAVVNANVLCYLGEIPETRAGVDWILKVIAEGSEEQCDKYYCSLLSVQYFFSRCYAAGIKGLEPARETAILRILGQAFPDGRFGASALDTALGMCALMNWGYNGPELETAAQFLLQQQEGDGSWARWCVYYGGPKKLSTFGSEELSTAFCLQALARYQQLRSGINRSSSNLH